MARKASRAAVQEATRTHEEVFKDNLPLIQAAKSDHEEAVQEAREKNAVYRSALKALKKGGGDLDALSFCFALLKLEPAEMDQRLRNINTYLRFMNAPVGTTLGLDLGTGKTIATAVEDEKLTSGAKARPVQLAEAYNEGHKAGRQGATLDRSNPYTDAALRAEYEKGWYDAQEDGVQALAPKKRGSAKQQPESVGHA